MSNYIKILNSIKKGVNDALNEYVLLDMRIYLKRQLNDFLNNLSCQEMKILYIDYSTLHLSTSLYNKFSIKQRLLENYNAPEPFEKVVSYLNENYKISGYNGQIKKIGTDKDFFIENIKAFNNISKIVVNIPNIGQNTDIIKAGMENCGYYLAYSSEHSINKNGKEYKWIALEFEPKYPNITGNDSKKIKKEFKFGIHISPIKNNNDIKSNVLVPKSENHIFSYPARIHLLRGDDKISELDIVDLIKAIKNPNEKETAFNIYVIDLNKLNNKFFFDCNYPWGFYTYENIQNDAIINEGIFDLTNEIDGIKWKENK